MGCSKVRPHLLEERKQIGRVAHVGGRGDGVDIGAVRGGGGLALSRIRGQSKVSHPGSTNTRRPV